MLVQLTLDIIFFLYYRFVEIPPVKNLYKCFAEYYSSSSVLLISVLARFKCLVDLRTWQIWVLCSVTMLYNMWNSLKVMLQPLPFLLPIVTHPQSCSSYSILWKFTRFNANRIKIAPSSLHLPLFYLNFLLWPFPNQLTNVTLQISNRYYLISHIYYSIHQYHHCWTDQTLNYNLCGWGRRRMCLGECFKHENSIINTNDICSLPITNSYTCIVFSFLRRKIHYFLFGLDLFPWKHMVGVTNFWHVIDRYRRFTVCPFCYVIEFYFWKINASGENVRVPRFY